VRALVQRVTHASVRVGDDTVGRIGNGLVVLVGVARNDSTEDAAYLAEKIANLRILPDQHDRFNVSVLEAEAELLFVSQFTLHADTRKGRRPSFMTAAPPEEAKALFDRLVELSRETGLKVETGQFQEHMLVEIHNDGPVTLMLDSADRHRPRSSAATGAESP